MQFKRKTKLKNTWVGCLALIMIINLSFSAPSLLAQSKEVFRTVTKPVPLTLANIFNALTGTSTKLSISQRNKIATQKVLEWGIDFSITPDIEKELRKAKASEELINAIRLKSKIISRPADPVDSELSYWESIKDGENEEDFKIYLSRYSNGRFVQIANERLQELQKSENLTEELAPISNSDDLGIAGTWIGTRGLESSNAFLMISGSKRNKFTGVLKIRGFHIAVQGRIFQKTRQIIMREIRIIETGSELSWTLSTYSGAISQDKKEMSGMMQEGAGNIAWSFARVD